MNRTRTSIAIGSAALLAMAALAPIASAQEDASEQDPMMASATHAAVGAWALESGGSMLFHSDGTMAFEESDGEVSFGAWEPRSEQTADLTFRFLIQGEEDDPVRVGTARATVDVADDGTTAELDATLEFPTLSGGTSGELGPIDVSMSRVIVSAPGEPVGPVTPEE